jgi:hypothetical protein
MMRRSQAAGAHRKELDLDLVTQERPGALRGTSPAMIEDLATHCMTRCLPVRAWGE